MGSPDDDRAHRAAAAAPGGYGGLDTPAVVVDLDVVERNALRLARLMAARGVALRPHVKTHKSVAIARIQAAAGAAGITVATLGEAELFAEHGFDDIFLAYPLWASAPKARRLAQLRGRVPSLAVGCDSADAARLLARVATGGTPPLTVMIEIDSGGRRSGVRPHDAARLAQTAAGLGLDVGGVFTHAGHGYRGAQARASAGRDELAALRLAAGRLRSGGFGERPGGLVISAGSTPTAELSARAPVTEERPGVYIFGDRTQALLGSCTWNDVALVVATTVVSVAVQRLGTQFVLDAGSKILSSDRAGWLAGHGHIVEYPQAEIEQLYEHHAVCRMMSGDQPPRPGTVLRVVPNHACMVPNNVPAMVAARGGTLTGEALPVDARARF